MARVTYPLDDVQEIRLTALLYSSLASRCDLSLTTGHGADYPKDRVPSARERLTSYVELTFIAKWLTPQSSVEPCAKHVIQPLKVPVSDGICARIVKSS
jgi:hypothetical protein